MRKESIYITPRLELQRSPVGFQYLSSYFFTGGLVGGLYIGACGGKEMQRVNRAGYGLSTGVD